MNKRYSKYSRNTKTKDGKHTPCPEQFKRIQENFQKASMFSRHVTTLFIGTVEYK